MHAALDLLCTGTLDEVRAAATAWHVDARLIRSRDSNTHVLRADMGQWDRVRAWWLQAGRLVRTLGPGEPR